MILALLSLLTLPVQAATPSASDSESPEVMIVLTIGSTEAQIGSKTSTLDAAPFIRDSRTYVPVRFVAESMGAKVGWVQEEQKVTIALEKNVIWLWIGKNTATVNDLEKTLDAPPIIESNRTFVPVRFVSENLGAAVSWNAHDQTVTVSYGRTKLTPPSPKTPTLVPAWMLSDDQIQDVLDRGNSISTADFQQFIVSHYGSPVTEEGTFDPSLYGMTFVLTPYALIFHDVYWNRDYRETPLSFEEVKENAVVSSNYLWAITIIYSNDKKFYEGHYFSRMKLENGTVLDPHPPEGTFTGWFLNDFATEKYPGMKYRGACVWVYDTAQIPRDAKIILEFTTPTGNQEVPFDLGKME
ncbi:MAG: copper amine oxidase N-terminal domain-containing protein [Coprothermobacterota bacterium]|nr:copper amine oxidase N-terminal domain-containing protein [Coprothermobacterota bacterium]